MQHLQKVSFTILQDGIKKQLTAKLLGSRLRAPQKAKLGCLCFNSLGNDIDLDFQINHGNLAPFTSLM